MLKTKVCGLTRLGDALLAEKLGADFLGFIFYKKSKRYISPRMALGIIQNLDPATDTVGVFVDEKPEKIIRVTRQLRLSMVQLHGCETNGMIRKLGRAGIRTIKAVAVDPGGKIISAVDYDSDLLLFDCMVEGRFGGTGRRFDPRALKNIKRRFLLSGGIKADNVVGACRVARPYGVDISSGLETRPGVKSPKKMKDFFKLMDKLNAKN